MSVMILFASFEGIDLEVDPADQLFVWAGSAERLPADQVGPGLDLDPHDLGHSRRRGDKYEQDGGKDS